MNGDAECIHCTISLGGSVSQTDWFGPNVGSYLALMLHLSNESCELSQSHCHVGSTVNIVNNNNNTNSHDSVYSAVS